MKVKIFCPICLDEGHKKDKNKTVPYIPSYPYWDYPTVELDKWPFIEFECSKGHTTRLLLNYELYELLFQQATYCLMDGYYRESVSTYNASLERYFEFATEVLFYSSATEADFSAIWKEMSNQSERQLGAFYLAYSTQVKKTPAVLNRKMVELRNAVVHKGKLATCAEAKEFGEYVFDFIKNIDAEIRNFIGEDYNKYSLYRKLRIQNEAVNVKEWINGQNDNIMNSTISGPCFLNSEFVKQYCDCFNMAFQERFGLIK